MPKSITAQRMNHIDHEAVVEFLGQVPLLQRLPSSSLRKIADIVQVKHFEPGQSVVREGESGEGIYIIWDGEAEVSGSSNDEEASRPEIQLKRYDFFGYGTVDSLHQANVCALSKLICLVVPDRFRDLLHSNSIWSADEISESLSILERILHLEPLEVDLFRGHTIPDTPPFAKVFGGQLIGQALAAATKTVDCIKKAHSMHSHFIMAGDKYLPIIYQVFRLRDGRSYSNRRVDAKQNGNLIFTILVSFQREEEGFEHMEARMPDVPAPEALPSMEQLRERRTTDTRFDINYQDSVAKKESLLFPIEMRFYDAGNSSMQTQPSVVEVDLSRMSYWFKARGKLFDDPALHRCIAAYASDLLFANISLNPHRKSGMKTTAISLDHSIWFHRPARADDWLLYVIESPSSSGGRGFVNGQIFNRKGELIMSLTQEATIRKAKQDGQVTRPKL